MALKSNSKAMTPFGSGKSFFSLLFVELRANAFPCLPSLFVATASLRLQHFLLSSFLFYILPAFPHSSSFNTSLHLYFTKSMALCGTKRMT